MHPVDVEHDDHDVDEPSIVDIISTLDMFKLERLPMNVRVILDPYVHKAIVRAKNNSQCSDDPNATHSRFHGYFKKFVLDHGLPKGMTSVYARASYDAYVAEQ